MRKIIFQRNAFLFVEQLAEIVIIITDIRRDFLHRKIARCVNVDIAENIVEIVVSLLFLGQVAAHKLQNNSFGKVIQHELKHRLAFLQFVIAFEHKFAYSAVVAVQAVFKLEIIERKRNINNVGTLNAFLVMICFGASDRVSPRFKRVVRAENIHLSVPVVVVNEFIVRVKVVSVEIIFVVVHAYA